jgi:hypothetical protein
MAMIYKKILLSIACAPAESLTEHPPDTSQKRQRLREYGVEDSAMIAEARKVMQ